MSKVGAICGATEDDLAKLTSKAKEMGVKTKFSATEAGEAFEYMAMAGWSTEEMLSGVEGIMNLAAASGENLATTSDIVTDALTAFGLSASDSAHFADILAKTSSSANTNVSLMGDTFKYVAPVAGALGFTAEDTAVAIGLMANSGIKASQAGTTLRTALSNMVKPTDAMQAKMDELKISITNSDGSMKSLSEIMKILRTSFSGLTDAEKTNAASTIFGSQAMSGMLAIINSSDEDFNSLTEQINNCDGASADMANTMNDNLSGAITLMQSSIESLQLAIFSSKMGGFQDFVEFIKTNVIDSITEVINGTKSLSDFFIQLFSSVNNVNPALAVLGTVLATATGGFVAFKAAMMVSAILSAVTTAIGGVTTALTILQTVGLKTTISMLLGFASPVTIVIAIIGALVAGFMYLWTTCEGFRNFWIGLWENISSFLSETWGNISVFFTETVPQAFNDLSLNIQQICNNIVQFFQDAWNGIVDFFTQTIPNWIISAKEWFDQLPYYIGYAIGLAIGYILQFGIDLVNFVLNDIPNFINSVASWFSQLPGKIWSWLLSSANKIKIWGINIYTLSKEWVLKTINNIVSYFSQLPGKIWSWLLSSANKVVTWGSNLYTKGKAAATKLLNSVVDGLKSLPSKMTSIGTNIVKGLWNGINNMVGWIGNKIKSFGSGVLNGLKNFFGIRSPSKLMADEVGKFLPKGINVGFEKEMPNAIDDINQSLKINMRDIDTGIDDINKMIYLNARGIDYGSIGYNMGAGLHNYHHYSNSVDSSSIATNIVDALRKSPMQVNVENHVQLDAREVGSATAQYVDVELGNNAGRFR